MSNGKHIFKVCTSIFIRGSTYCNKYNFDFPKTFGKISRKF